MPELRLVERLPVGEGRERLRAKGLRIVVWYGAGVYGFMLVTGLQTQPLELGDRDEVLG